MTDTDQQATEQTVSIDGVSYPISSLSPQAQQLVLTYNDWSGDAAEANKKASQLKVAVEALTNQIVQQVRADNQAKVDAEAATKANDADKTAGDADNDAGAAEG